MNYSEMLRNTANVLEELELTNITSVHFWLNCPEVHINTEDFNLRWPDSAWKSRGESEEGEVNPYPWTREVTHKDVKVFAIYSDEQKNSAEHIEEARHANS